MNDAVRMDTNPADGRDTRWEAHRVMRRRELVTAAIRAIRQHGHEVGMEDIAAAAGTSKTVLYRHLGGRMGLYLAVCEFVDSMLLSDLGAALSQSSGALFAAGDGDVDADPRQALVAVIDSYLSLVERDPEVYRFVLRPPSPAGLEDPDPVTGLIDTVTATISGALAGALTSQHKDATPAPIWARALVGYVRETADQWVGENPRMPREQLVQYLADFATVGLEGVLSSP